MAGLSGSPWQGRGQHARFCALALTCMAFALGCQSRLADTNQEPLLEELSLSAEEIDFGQMGLGETARRTIEVRNRGRRTLHLLEPDRNCGCTRAALGANELSPGQGTTLEVEFVAPRSPGEVVKHVWLLCGELAEDRWPVKVRCRVAADVWAEPGIVRVEVPRGGSVTTSVLLRHEPTVRIARVEADAPELSVAMNDAGELAREVTLAIADTGLSRHQGVDANMAVYLESSAEPVLRVPVRWQLRSKVRFVPDTLTVVLSGQPMQRTVVLLLDDEVQAESLDIAPLVPGVEVVSRKTDGKRVILRLAVDAERLSPGRIAVVRARSHDGEEHDELTIERAPGA